jgi:hypothetical protein
MLQNSQQPQPEVQTVEEVMEPRTVTSLIDLFTAIRGLEVVGMNYTFETIDNPGGQDRHWLIHVTK